MKRADRKFTTWTDAIRLAAREPFAVDEQTFDRLGRRSQIAARHCAELGTCGPQHRARRRLWSLMHLACMAARMTWDAYHIGNSDGVEAWRESTRRACLELDALAEYGQRWPDEVATIARLHMEGGAP